MYSYAASLVRVIDGDTVVLDLDLGFGIWRRNEPYRLLRINAPEMPSKEGKAAKAALTSFLEGKPLLVETHKSDVYGRFLAEITAGGESVSDWLVANGYAVYKDYK